MGLITREFNLCIVPSEFPPTIDLSQYDDGVQCIAHFVDESGAPYDIPTGSIITIEGINRKYVPFQFHAEASTTRTATFTPYGAATDCYGKQVVTLKIVKNGMRFTPLAIVLNIQKSGLTKEDAADSEPFKDAVEEAFNEYISEHGVAGDAVRYTPMNLTPAQKAQARLNIGASSGGESAIDAFYVTPEMFGAIGDGETDDTEAMQAAFASRQSVYLGPHKTYLVYGSLTIDSNQVVDLNGSTIKQCANLPLIVKPDSKNAVSRVMIRNGNLEGTTAYYDQNNNLVIDDSMMDQYGIKLPSFHSTFEDLRIDGFAFGHYIDRRGNYETTTATLVENKFRNIRFTNCITACLRTDTNSRAQNGFLADIICAGRFDYGIDVRTAPGWRGFNLNAYGDCKDTAIRFTSCDATILTGVHVDHFEKKGLVLDRWGGAYLTNAVIRCDAPGCIGLSSGVSASSSWIDRPLVMSNVEFRTLVNPSTFTSDADYIFPIKSWGAVQASNLYYQDKYGAFRENQETPAIVHDGYELPRVTGDDFGKMAVVGPDGEWIVTDQPLRLYSKLLPDGTLFQMVGPNYIAKPIIGRSPKDITAGQNTTQSIDVVAFGDDLTYQWQRRHDDTEWENLSGAVNDSITFSMTYYTNQLLYRCLVSDGVHTVASDPARMNLVLPEGTFVITRSPVDAVVSIGDTATFMVIVYGDVLSYQWQYKTRDGNVWTNSEMPGADESAVHVEATALRNGQKYRCIVTDQNETVLTSGEATLEVI